MGRRKTVYDQIPGGEVLGNPFIPDDVYANILIRIVSFNLFLLVL